MEQPNIAQYQCPLNKLRLQIMIGFLDAKGTSRNFDETVSADVHSTSEGAYEGVFDVCDYAYSGHFDLTGEYCIRIELGTVFGVSNGLRRSELVVACFSRKKVGELVANAKKARETPVAITIPGFMNTAAEGHSRNAQVTIEAVAKKRVVLIQAVKISVPVDDAKYIVDQIALYKKQMSSDC